MSRVRTGSSSADGGRGRASGPPQQYQGAMSGYGPSRADSVGYNPKNPFAYLGALGAKAYPTVSGPPTPNLSPPKV